MLSRLLKRCVMVFVTGLFAFSLVACNGNDIYGPDNSENEENNEEDATSNDGKDQE